MAEAVSRAAALVDPDGADPAVRGLLEAYEDDDRPATAVEDLAGELRSSTEGIDPEGDSPAASVAVAASVWLATNPDQFDGSREHVLREAVRLGFEGDPPGAVGSWLTEQGIEA